MGYAGLATGAEPRPYPHYVLTLSWHRCKSTPTKGINTMIVVNFLSKYGVELTRRWQVVITGVFTIVGHVLRMSNSEVLLFVEGDARNMWTIFRANKQR